MDQVTYKAPSSVKPENPMVCCNKKALALLQINAGTEPYPCKRSQSHAKQLQLSAVSESLPRLQDRQPPIQIHAPALEKWGVSIFGSGPG